MQGEQRKRFTGYLLQAVTRGAGAGPILDEGIAVTFARSSRPRGRQTADDPEANADQRSETEEAYLRAKDTSFRHDPVYKKFRDTLARCSDESHALAYLGC